MAETSTIPDTTTPTRDPRRPDGRVEIVNVESVNIGYLTLEATGRYLGTSKRTVRRWIAEHDLPHYYIGGPQRGKLLFKKGEVDRWVRRHRGGAVEREQEPELDREGSEGL